MRSLVVVLCIAVLSANAQSPYVLLGPGQVVAFTDGGDGSSDNWTVGIGFGITDSINSWLDYSVCLEYVPGHYRFTTVSDAPRQFQSHFLASALAHLRVGTHSGHYSYLVVGPSVWYMPEPDEVQYLPMEEFNVGLRAGAGISTGQWRIQLTYDQTVMDASTFDGFSTWPGYGQLELHYVFGR